jgi:nucleoside-diphosphate-sugar epimerase
MAEILITGGTGFIGSRIVSDLALHHHLFAFYHERQTDLNIKGVTWIKQDLSNPLEERHLPEELDGIIHLAQSRYYRNFPEMGEDIFRVNIEGTFRLLEFGKKRGIKKFIYASSGGIYGYSYEKFIETDVINPVNFYLTSKYCSELLIGNYNPYFSTVVFRFFFVYGPKQLGMLIPRLIDNIKREEPIVIYGKSGVRINPIHIMDAIKVFRTSLETPVTGIFNVAGDEIVSIKELSEMIADLVGNPPRFIYERSNIPGDIIGENSRMKSVMGVTPTISLRKGIDEVIRATGDG